MKNRAQRRVLTLAIIAAEILFSVRVQHCNLCPAKRNMKSYRLRNGNEKCIEAETKKPDFAGRANDCLLYECEYQFIQKF
jgi:hypothetical protein